MWSMFRFVFRTIVISSTATALLTLSACGFSAPMPTPTETFAVGNTGGDTGTGSESYAVSGGDGKYQFAGVLCNTVAAGIEPAAAGVSGGASLLFVSGDFTFKWIYSDGGGEQSDTAVGKIIDVAKDDQTISVTATYDGHASIGDAGKNTKIEGTMTFTGTRVETPASCTE
jgi:hypothetical protein